MLRNGVPVEYPDARGRRKSDRARVIDFGNAPGSNRFLAVRELKLTGMRTPNYHRRADLVCFVNGMLKSLREALAQYALGDDGDAGEEMVAPVEERVQALIEAIEAAEAHLRGLGFDPARLVGSTGFARIQGLKDAVEAVYSSDKAKRRFEVLARQVFVRFKALLMELMEELDEEQKRAVQEGLDEDELALFDLLRKDPLARTERERIKQASRNLLASIKERLSKLDRFWKKEQTKAEVEVFILDRVYAVLPTPPFTDDEKKAAAAQVYAHVWQQAVSGRFGRAA